jgi:hypothetical protein
MGQRVLITAGTSGMRREIAHFLRSRWNDK